MDREEPGERYMKDMGAQTERGGSDEKRKEEGK